MLLQLIITTSVTTTTIYLALILLGMISIIYNLIFLSTS